MVGEAHLIKGKPRSFSSGDALRCIPDVLHGAFSWRGCSSLPRKGRLQEKMPTSSVRAAIGETDEGKTEGKYECGAVSAPRVLHLWPS